MKAVISVIGKDTVGILAGIAQECAAHNANITEVTQSVLGDLFCMIMLCDASGLDIAFADFAAKLAAWGDTHHLSVHAMHEGIFNAMHRI